MTGIKEGICCDEHRVLYVSHESLNSTPETNIILYINKLEFNKQLGKNKMKDRVGWRGRGIEIENMNGYNILSSCLALVSSKRGLGIFFQEESFYIIKSTGIRRHEPDSSLIHLLER